MTRRARFVSSLAPAALLVALITGGYWQIDGGFVRRVAVHDLERQPPCQGLTVMPGDQVRLELTGTETCRLRTGHLVAGDQLSLDLGSPDGAQEVELRLGSDPPRRLLVGPAPDRYKLVVLSPGARLCVRRLDADAGSLVLSRIFSSSTIGYASGPLTGYLLHDLHPTGRTWAGAGLAALTAGGVLVLLLAWGRRNGRGWRETLLLLPAAVLLVVFALVGWLSPLHLAYPPATFVILVLAPLLLVAVLRTLRGDPAPAGQCSWSETLVQPWTGRRFPLVVGAALVAALTVWIVLLPQSPHEGDEARLLSALRQYDVSHHSPHPPGYPVYVAVSAALATAVGPLRGTQLTSVLGALLALLGSGLTARRLGAGRGPVLLAGLLLATVPAFTFYANVSLSDMLGTGLAAVAVLALVRVIDAPDHRWRLPVAAIAVAVSLGVRPQLVLVVAAAGVWAVLRTVTAGAWRRLAAALAAGVLTSVLCWAPAVALTGWQPFVRTIQNHSARLLVKEASQRLPGAPLAIVLDQWLVRPFGSGLLAAGLWLLVIVGTVAWWRSGRRRLVLVCIAGGGGYLLAAPWSMSYQSSVRYLLPALPLLAVLASGVAVLERRNLARLGVAAALCLAGLQVVWTAPALLLRARQPAPVWAALTWIAEHADPATTQVICARPLLPHATYLLGRTAILTTISEQPRAEPALRPVVWEVMESLHEPADRVGLYRSAWQSAPLQQLTRNRYNHCVVVRRADPLSHSERGPQHRVNLISLLLDISDYSS